MNTFLGEIVGYLSGAFTTIAFLPQVIKSIITKNVSGLSMYMYIIYCMGLIFWILYGVYLFNVITLVLNGIILCMIIRKNVKKKKK